MTNPYPEPGSYSLVPERSRVHQLARLSLPDLVIIWNQLNEKLQNHGPAILAIASCGDRDKILAAIRELEDPRERVTTPWR